MALVTVPQKECILCGQMDIKLKFSSLYCSLCNKLVHKNHNFYIGKGDEMKFCFCSGCYSTHHVAIEISAFSFKKEQLEMKKHDKSHVEEWIQCNQCKTWQHHLCAYLNTNAIGEGSGLCDCAGGDYLIDPTPQKSVQLPRTDLSDFLEERLCDSLRKDRENRARSADKIYDQVEGADGLTVRVVSSLKKLLKVNQAFRGCFDELNFPAEFLFKSKAILLFQKIEEFDTCLFCMFVQEYGSCSEPNCRSVNISSIDSNQYFIPKIKASTGESLRTFVYHEILVGYLGYCKKRGFLKCYIWAWPPPKAEEWLFYCHPVNQKSPTAERLRKWFKAMLKKASNECIVSSVSNLHESFFTSRNGFMVSGSRVPYFSGDYWPGEAESILKRLQINDREKLRHVVTETFGATLHKLKKNFFVVNFHLACTRCSSVIIAGERWVCTECQNFQLCQKCFLEHGKLDIIKQHPENITEKHAFCKVPVRTVPDYKEEEEEGVILDSDIFEGPQTFLNFCKENVYQFDTLARAKCSSQKLLNHLLNQVVPDLVTCSWCVCDIEGGNCHKCNDCLEYALCSTCSEDSHLWIHDHPWAVETDAQRKKKILGYLHHLSECMLDSCDNPGCIKFKPIIKHGVRRFSKLVKLHSLNCTTMDCQIDGCRGFQQYAGSIEARFEADKRRNVTTFSSQSKGRATKDKD